MIPQKVAEGIAILAGMGGFLSCLALHIAARGIASLRRSKPVVITGLPRQPIVQEAPKPPPLSTQHIPPLQAAPPVTQSPEAVPNWNEHDDRLVGTYRTRNHTYAGYISNWQLARREFFIINPPQELRQHPHGRLLIHRGNGCYLIRMPNRPATAAAGVHTIEQLLAEADGTGNLVIRPAERPAQTDRIVVRPVDRTPVEVRPKYRAYWQLKDWRVQGDLLVGRYDAGIARFDGYIKQHRSREPLFFVVNPPEQLERHPHRACFHSKGNGHFWVHFGIKPTNPDGGIREIEKVLAEALRLPRR